MKYTQPLNEAEDAHYINGDPSIGQTGSIIPAGALENPQREIVNAITDAGLTPSASNNSQLAQAISAKITAASNTLQTQINAKAADNAVVKLTGNQTISGTKTYNSSPLVPNVTSGDNSTKAANTAFVDGVRSAIQTQIDAHTTAINGKQATVTGAATTITGSNLTASRAVISNSSGKMAVSNTTSTELGYVHGVRSAIQTQLNGKQPSVSGAATTITDNNLTASRALVSNSSGKVAVSSVTGTELGYLSGVTSAVQTQINGKQATVTGAATTITGSNLTASRAVISNSSGKMAVSDTTSTELGYVHGVTSAIQTQINNRITAAISKAANGYWVDNKNGLIVQWGRVLVKKVTNKSNITTITLPKAFTTTNYSFVGIFENNTSTSVIYTDDVTFCTTEISKTAVKGFGFDAGGNGYDAYMRWIAIGY